MAQLSLTGSVPASNDMDEEPKSRSRDDYWRCKICKQLNSDKDCERDDVSGAYLCPNGCKVEFVQPPYESPLSD